MGQWYTSVDRVRGAKAKALLSHSKGRSFGVLTSCSGLQDGSCATVTGRS